MENNKCGLESEKLEPVNIAGMSVKYGKTVTIWPKDFTSTYIYERIEYLTEMNACVVVFSASLFTVVKR